MKFTNGHLVAVDAADICPRHVPHEHAPLGVFVRQVRIQPATETLAKIVHRLARVG